jgi:hypothetical protein
MARKILLVLSLSLLALVLLAAAYVLKESRSEEVAFMNEPRYELGDHQGSEVCGTCHEELYAEWRTYSRHAVSTSAESVIDVDPQLCIGRQGHVLRLSRTRGSKRRGQLRDLSWCGAVGCPDHGNAREEVQARQRANAGRGVLCQVP